MDKTLNPTAEELQTLNEVLANHQAAGFLGKFTMQEALALALAGRELGLPVFRSLNELYIGRRGDGTKDIAQTAAGMRARVLEQGVGYVDPVAAECNDRVGVVEACRYGRGDRPDRVQRFSYGLTSDDAPSNATADGLSWAKDATNRPAMLLARATSAAARAMFSDILAGVSYTPEEIESVGQRSGAPGMGSGASTKQQQGTAAEPTPAVVDGVKHTAVPPTTSEAGMGVASQEAGAGTSAGNGATSVVTPPASPPARQPDEIERPAPVEPKNRPRSFLATWDRSVTPPRAFHTHGIEEAQVYALIDWMDPQKNPARHVEARGIIDEVCRQLGIDERLKGKVCYFTKEEAAKAITFLERRCGENGGPPPTPEKEAEKVPAPPPPAEPEPVSENGPRVVKDPAFAAVMNRFEKMLKDAQLEKERPSFVEWLLKAFNVETLEDITVASLTEAVVEFEKGAAQPSFMLDAVKRELEGLRGS